MAVRHRDSDGIVRKKRKFYEGSTTAEVLGPVLLDAWGSKDEWKLPYKDKRDIFGANRVECGGRVDDCSSLGDDVPPDVISHLNVGQGRGAKRTREDTNVAPVFFHRLPLAFWQEVLASTDANGMISCTPGPGVDAMACVISGKPYTGICFNHSHKLSLEEHIKQQILSCWQKPTLTDFCESCLPCARHAVGRRGRGGFFQVQAGDQT